SRPTRRGSPPHSSMQRRAARTPSSVEEPVAYIGSPPRNSGRFSSVENLRSTPRLETVLRSEEHTSELQSVSISYAVFCLKKKNAQHRAGAKAARSDDRRRNAHALRRFLYRHLLDLAPHERCAKG